MANYEDELKRDISVAKTITLGIGAVLLALILSIVTYNVTERQLAAQVALQAVQHGLCQQESHAGRDPFWGPCSK